MSNDINVNEISEALNDKLDRDFGNALFTNDTFAQLRSIIMSLDFSAAINVTPDVPDGISSYTAPSDGIFFGLNYGGGRFAVNGVKLGNDTATNGERNAFLWFPLNKGDTINYWGGNWGGVGTQKFIPYKYQSGQNNLQLDGLTYQGKYATISVLQQVTATHGRWALVGNDNDGYNRYFTRPTDNSFTSYEWADGGKDISTGDYVVEWKAPTVSDATWYRLYKSGWIEQGGQYNQAASAWTTITLLKEMADLSYRVIISQQFNDTVYFKNATCGAYVYSTTEMKISCYSNAGQMNWEVKGFAAQS